MEWKRTWVAAAVAVVALAAVLPAPAAAAGTTAGAWPAGPAGVVVNEFAPSGSSGEFVELRNTSNQSVNLIGWDLRACTGGSSFILISFGNTSLPPDGRFLIAHISWSAGGGPTPDLLYFGDVPDDGGWELTAPSFNSDGVGLQSGLSCTEGSPAPGCGWSAGQAVTRDAAGTDTDDNATDFTCQARTPGW